jgi:hypothetical protein
MKTTNEKVFDLLEATNLNWEVSKEQLFAGDGTPTQTYGIFKKTHRKHLGSVSNRYEMYQNWQMAEALILASEEVGVEFSRGGELNAGRKVYLQAQLPTEFIGNSNVLRYITALNSHDGSSSIGFGSSNVVVACQNAFHKAMKDLLRFRHTSSAPERIKDLAVQIRTAMLQDAFMMENFKGMAAVTLRDEWVDKVIHQLFKDEPPTANAVSQRNARVQSFHGALQTEIGLEGNNAWGLFNAVTRYTNHIALPNKNRQEYLMTGSGYKMSNMTYDLLCKELGLLMPA